MREPTADKRGLPTLAALGDHGVEADAGDERRRIGEARRRAELPEQRGGGVWTDPGDRLQQVGIGRSRAGLARGQPQILKGANPGDLSGLANAEQSVAPRSGRGAHLSASA
jgi:hypothetical protein